MDGVTPGLYAARLSVGSGTLTGMDEPRTRELAAEPTHVAPEQRLLLELAAWSTWSVAAGGVLWRVGRRDGERALGDAGRMTLAWGLADAAVVGWGVARGRRASAADPAARSRRMAVVTGVNALLDVAYVAAGARLAAGRRRRGDGAAVAVQGAFLLYLDTRYCLEFAAQARAARAALVPSAETEQALGAPRLGPCTRPASSTSPGGRGGPGAE